MKTTCTALLCLLLSVSVYANTNSPEELKSQDQSTIELGKLIDSFFEDKTGLVQDRQEHPEMKIIIMNSDFRKVREDKIRDLEEINNESTLVPVIYRAEFVANIYNVLYYVLKD